MLEKFRFITKFICDVAGSVDPGSQRWELKGVYLVCSNVSVIGMCQSYSSMNRGPKFV